MTKTGGLAGIMEPLGKDSDKLNEDSNKLSEDSDKFNNEYEDSDSDFISVWEESSDWTTDDEELIFKRITVPPNTGPRKSNLTRLLRSAPLPDQVQMVTEEQELCTEPLKSVEEDSCPVTQVIGTAEHECPTNTELPPNPVGHRPTVFFDFQALFQAICTFLGFD